LPCLKEDVICSDASKYIFLRITVGSPIIEGDRLRRLTVKRARAIEAAEVAQAVMVALYT
jgi:hypothetical protein